LQIYRITRSHLRFKYYVSRGINIVEVKHVSVLVSEPICFRILSFIRHLWIYFKYIMQDLNWSVFRVLYVHIISWRRVVFQRRYWTVFSLDSVMVNKRGFRCSAICHCFSGWYVPEVTSGGIAHFQEFIRFYLSLEM